MVLYLIQTFTNFYKVSNKNRDKGHRYERWLRNFFKDLGFVHCQTARYGSRLLDDCGIDLMNIPFWVQAKAGYNKGLNYTSILNQMDENIEKNGIDKLPKLIFHKKSGRKSNEHLVIMNFEDFEKIITNDRGDQ